MATNTVVGSTNVLYTCSEFFYNIDVPTNMFSQGYVDLKFECPALLGDVDFVTGKPQTTFVFKLDYR